MLRLQGPGRSGTNCRSWQPALQAHALMARKSLVPLWTMLGLAVVQLVGGAAEESVGGPASALTALGSGAERGTRGHSSKRPSRERAPEARDAKSHSGPEAERKAETEKDRGRAAETPAEIPAKGWKDILWRTYEEMNKDRILAVAAGVTYFGLLALFPAITALVSMYGLFADAATINDHLTALSGSCRAAPRTIIGEQVKRITGTRRAARSASPSSSAWRWPCGAPTPA